MPKKNYKMTGFRGFDLGHTVHIIAITITTNCAYHCFFLGVYKNILRDGAG